jgi:hypothetical protein
MRRGLPYSVESWMSIASRIDHLQSGRVNCPGIGNWWREVGSRIATAFVQMAGFGDVVARSFVSHMHSPYVKCKTKSEEHCRNGLCQLAN